MSKVTNFYTSTTTIATTSTSSSVYIGTGWDISKSILSFSITSPSNAGYFEAALISGKLYMDGSGLYVKFERASSGVYIEISISYTIIQLTTATVTQGATTFTSSQTSKTITISSVDTAKTFILATCRCDVLSIAPEYFLFTANLASSTSLVFERGVASGNLYIEYQIITISDIKSIQIKNGTVTNSGSNQTDITITSVDTSKTLVINTYKNTYTSFDNHHMREAHLTSSTNLRFEAVTNIASGTITYNIWVIEFLWDKVYSGEVTISGGNTTATASIGATIDTNKSLDILSGMMNMCLAENNSAADNAGDVCHRVTAMSSTQITIGKGKSGATTYAAWQVIEFKEAPKGYPIISRRRKTMDLKQSTSIEVLIGPFISETDFTTRQTSLSLAASNFRIKKNGGTPAAPTLSGSITHSHNGNYKVTLATGDVDTAGILELTCDIAGSTQCQREYNVLTAAQWDIKYGSGVQDVNVSKMNGSTLNAGAWADLAANVSSTLTKATTIEGKLPSGGQNMSGATDLAAINTKLGTPAGASVSADIVAVKSDTSNSLTKITTIEGKLPSGGQNMSGATDLQTVDTVVDNIKTDTGSTLTKVTNIETKIGTPVGISISADIAAIKAETNETVGDVNNIVSKLPSDSIAGVSDVDSKGDDILSILGTPLSTISGDIAEVNNNVLNIQNNANFVASLVDTIILPEAPNYKWLPISVQLRNSSGAMNDPDSNEISVQIRSDKTLNNYEVLYKTQEGVLSDVSSKYTPSYFKMTKINTGEYEIWVKILNTMELDSYTCTFRYAEDTAEQVNKRNFYLQEGEAIVNVELADSANNRGIVAKSLKNMNVSGTSSVSGSIYEAVITPLQQVVSKLPSGIISDLSMASTVEGIALNHILSLVMAMADGNYVINESTGVMTLYRRDNITPLTEIVASTISRIRQ